MNTGFVILCVVAFITAGISAVLGMGGGILLLAVMLGFMSHGEAIPLHAAVQLASNSTRLIVFVRDADRRAVIHFAIGAVPGTAAGTVILWWIGRLGASEPYLKCLVGVYVLAAAFLPKPKKTDGRAPGWDFTAIGLGAGLAALTVGAVGPLIAPIFAHRDFVKERLIATKAACQMLTHLLKLPAFVLLGTFSIGKLGPLAVCMILLVIPGTLLGRRLVPHVTPRAFRLMYRVALGVAGGKVLVFDGLMRLL